MAASAIAQINAVARVSFTATGVTAKAQAPVSVAKKLPALDRSASLTRKAAWGAARTNKPRHNLAVCAAADVEVQAETAAPKRRGGRAKREVTVQFEDIAVGNVYPGKVASVQAYGAFVNFGAKNDGLVHISELTEGFVENVGEVVSEGQEVEVRVLNIDTEKNRVGLSMRPPREARETGETGEVEVDESGKPVRRGKVATRGKAQKKDKGEAPPVKKGEKYMAVVKTITPFGAFVELKIEGVEGVEGLVHISQLSEGVVDTVESVVSLGQEVEVRVQSVDGRRISLTMKEEFDLSALNAAAAANIGPSFSVFELALKQAGVSRDMFPETEEKAAPAEEKAAPAEEAAPAPAAAAPVEEAAPAPAADAAPAAGTSA